MSGKKSGKSQGILRWIIRGNPDLVITCFVPMMIYLFVFQVG